MKKTVKLIILAAMAIAALAGAAALFKRFAEKASAVEEYDGEAMFIG